MRSKTADEILEKIRNKKTPYFVTYNGLWIRVDSEVYPPSADSFFLADNLRGIFGVKQGERVFDYGCGSGILSLVSANCGGNVVGVDINPNAVNCARINASTNNLDINIEIRQGGFGALFEEERFDVAIIHTYEERGRQFVQDARKVNPNVFILTFSAGKKILRFGDTFIVDTGRNRGEMVERIREGIETKRKTAKPITRSLP